MAKSNAGPPPGEDELVPLAEIVRASGWPAFRVRLALGEAGERLLVYPGRGFQGREDRRRKLYPLHYTLALLRAQEGEKRPERPDLEADERVPLERITTDLGWAPNTVKRYLLAARRLVHTFPDPKDNRKKLYPLRYTVRLLRREHGRVQARRLRMRDEGAGYWTALASLKVAVSRLRHASSEISAVGREVGEAFEALRRRPPLVVEIYTLADPGLDLLHPLTVLVAPLRLVYWRATVPEIPLRGEASTQEEAILDLREKLAGKFRQLQEQPSMEPDLWRLLNELIRGEEPPPEVRERGEP